MKNLILATILGLLAASYAGIGNTQSGPNLLMMPEKEARNLQRTTPSEDLWENGDYWRSPRKWGRFARQTTRGGWGFQDWPDIVWGKTKRPVRSRMVILDPPLPRIAGPDKVQIEWFNDPVDEDGTGYYGNVSTLYIMEWLRSMDEHEVPTEFVVQLVGKGPTLLRRYNETRRVIQDMIYAWDNPSIFRGAASDVFQAMMGTPGNVRTRDFATSIVEDAGYSAEEWHARAKSERTEERVQKINGRFKELMDQARKQTRKILRTPHNPIILIDGKYLLTLSVNKKRIDLFQMANWIIHKQIEQIPSHGFSTESFGIATKPGDRELIALKTKPTGNEGLEVEWLFSYVSDEGKRTHSTWLNRTFNEWLRQVQNEGKPVQFTRTPVTGTPGNPWHQHQAVHQMLALTGTMASGERWEGVGESIGRWLNGNPQGLSTEEEVSLLLLSKGIPKTAFMTRAASKETREKAEAANARAETVRRALKARRLPDIEPVLLINGKWILSGGSAGKAGHIIEILNWLRENG